MTKQEGPSISTTKNCMDCKHLDAAYWSIEDGNDYDWGFDYRCERAEREIGSTSRTPDWCPFMKEHV